ncbi:MAG: 4-hydroxy-3-methylbut-2-enyl diphosphate reductase [Deltaproteobacteria bacterium]|nr:4-hydroxy-3-methylbut-2-enyl diphosphate reductase [Deltaproteobacteria bacterium]
MKIRIAKSAGFCFGVKRATNLALDAAARTEHIHSLGPIIHSPQVVKKLQEKGVQVAHSVSEIECGAVIIRSHGITLDDQKEIARRHLEIVDATCPFVKKAQQHAELLSSKGYALVLVGEKEHPEVQGIFSYARGGDVFVVADADEAEKLPCRKRVGVVAQTTQAYDNFSRIVAVCLEKCEELRVFKTICDATAVRQNEARDIASQSDVMLVIGGFNSANTTRLATICREIIPCTHHIETAEEIDPQWFDGVESVGVTAGASTPHWVIEEVVERVQSIGKKGDN